MFSLGRMKLFRSLVPVVIGSCALLLGCSDQAIIWSAESASPNGQFIASAQTTQYGGPGTAYVGTEVYLKQAGSKSPLLILGFANGSAYPSGVTAVGLHWLSNSQLDVTYKATATINFQAVTALGVAISVNKPNQAMQPTTGRREDRFSMIQPLPLQSTRALASGG